MHSRIFSERERNLLKAWIEGRSVDTISLSKILYRFRVFKTLESDISLYLAVKRKAEPKTATST
jgi:hypothetical protein